MNYNATIEQQDVHVTHGHFSRSFDFGDHLQVGPTLEELHKENMKKLRHQFLNQQNVEEKLCYRTCFKLSQKKYVEFCLDKKCGGVPLKDAAQALGYVKH